MTEICPFCRSRITPNDRHTVLIGVIRVHESCFKEHIEKLEPKTLRQHKEDRDEES